MSAEVSNDLKVTLAGWRKAKGYTQDAFSEKIGVPLPTYVRWEKNASKIPISKALKAARVLGVDINDIIFETRDTKCVV